MPLKSISLLVPNAVLFITGSDTKDIPAIERGSNIWSTPTCIAVGCQPDVDGDTRIIFGPTDQIGLDKEPAFDGELQTPTQVVSVDIVHGKKILQDSVSAKSTRVRVWMNHPAAPDKITIGLG